MARTAAQIRAEMAHRELARRHYIHYLSYVNGLQWKHTRFAEHIANTIEEFIETDTGNAYDILILETPPQHGKSTAVTEALPSWVLGRHPDWRIIIASYNDETAERFARANKDKVALYGDNLFNMRIGGVSRSREFGIVQNGKPVLGKLLSRGILGGITGNPANLIIIDDPIKNREEADSPMRRRKIWDEWLNSLKSRLQAHSKVVVIMTPWHEDDLAARLLNNEENVTLVRLPVEAEENDPLGREVGEALCPELGKDNRWLEQFKKSYLSDAEGGARAWSALYQCSPRAEEGNLVKRSWWRYYDAKAITTFATSVISVDATFKGGEGNDFVAIEVWGKINNDYYLRYCMNRHMDFPETLKAIRTVKKLYPDAMSVLIEDKANGSAIIQTLQKEMFCIPVNPRGGKEARVNAISPAVESGHVYLPNGEPWLHEFVDQFTAFPAGKNDDMVDSASQALSYMLFSSGTMPTTAPKVDGNGYDDLATATLDSDALYEPYNNYF